MLNFHEFLHTMYICAKFCCENAMMFAKYFEYYTIILRGGAFFRGHAVYCYYCSICKYKLHCIAEIL